MAASRDPVWSRNPPHVPRYPNIPDMLRRTPADTYTATSGTGSYQRWWDKWYAEHPGGKTDKLKFGPQAHSNWSWEFQPGTTKANFKKSPYETAAPFNDVYHRIGNTDSETKRARASYGISYVERDEKLYPFSNAMTSTYRTPVFSKYGPMLRREVYGVYSQHNRHGNMPFDDYY